MPYPSKKRPVKIKKQPLVDGFRAGMVVLGILAVLAGFLFYSEYNKYKAIYIEEPETQLAPGIPERRQWNCTVHPDQCPDPAILHIRTA